jgi:hypothetical protein
VGALQALAHEKIGYAEAWRRLRPVAGAAGVARPSYWRVRRFLEVERDAIAARRELVRNFVGEVLVGRVPTAMDFVTMQHELASVERRRVLRHGIVAMQHKVSSERT